MIHTLKLLLPALIPSWNFFDVIADSPRIEYTLLSTPDEAGDWLEFRPHPESVSAPAMIGRLFWNARWNETLFVVSCAERLLDMPTARTQDEIFRRIAADLKCQPPRHDTWLRFRIALVSQPETEIARDIAFISEARRLSAISTQ